MYDSDLFKKISKDLVVWAYVSKFRVVKVKSVFMQSDFLNFQNVSSYLIIDVYNGCV